MRPNAAYPSIRDRCDYAASLRRRAQIAEAQLERLRAERDAARESRDAAFAKLDAERRALAAHLDSPAWERDLLLMAQARVRAELTDLAAQRRSCGTCGGFGRGVYDGLLSGAIAALTDANGLEAAEATETVDWPRRMGAVSHQGQMLNTDWLSPPREGRKKARRAAVW